MQPVPEGELKSRIRSLTFLSPNSKFETKAHFQALLGENNEKFSGGQETKPQASCWFHHCCEWIFDEGSWCIYVSLCIKNRCKKSWSCITTSFPWCGIRVTRRSQATPVRTLLAEPPVQATRTRRARNSTPSSTRARLNWTGGCHAQFARNSRVGQSVQGKWIQRPERMVPPPLNSRIACKLRSNQQKNLATSHCDWHSQQTQ